MTVHAEVDMLLAQIISAKERFDGLPEEVRKGEAGQTLGLSLQAAQIKATDLIESMRAAEQNERADWAASGIGGG